MPILAFLAFSIFRAGFLRSFLKWVIFFFFWPFLAFFKTCFFTLKFSKNGQFYRPPKMGLIFEGPKNDLKLYTERRWVKKQHY